MRFKDTTIILAFMLLSCGSAHAFGWDTPWSGNDGGVTAGYVATAITTATTNMAETDVDNDFSVGQTMPSITADEFRVQNSTTIPKLNGPDAMGIAYVSKLYQRIDNQLTLMSDGSDLGVNAYSFDFTDDAVTTGNAYSDALHTATATMAKDIVVYQGYNALKVYETYESGGFATDAYTTTVLDKTQTKVQFSAIIKTGVGGTLCNFGLYSDVTNLTTDNVMVGFNGTTATITYNNAATTTGYFTTTVTDTWHLVQIEINGTTPTVWIDGTLRTGACTGTCTIRATADWADLKAGYTIVTIGSGAVNAMYIREVSAND